MFKNADFIRFASDADLLSLWGAGFLAVAVAAAVLDRRRLKRRQIDRVGWMPWTAVFLVCVVIGAGLLATALPAVLAG